MAEYRKYSIRQNRFKRSFLSGFEIGGEDVLRCRPDVYHSLFICDCIDGIESEAKWGRFHLDFQLEEDMVVAVYAVALDQKEIPWKGGYADLGSLFMDSEISAEEKIKILEVLEAKKHINRKDILLYELEGRYLYFCVEVLGLGKGELKNLFVNNQGDIFIDTFPEVYREYGSFFHRYMSVYSSLYMDFQEKIDNVEQFLDIDTAPVQLLPIFCQWMGVDVSGDFLTENRLRTLVKEAYHLNRTKGTKEALLRVCEIILDEKVVILEKNVIRENTQAETHKIYEQLYGNGFYDVTILVRTFVPENQKSQLEFLLNQFKPVRSRLRIKFLDQKDSLDGHVYMDVNAQVMDTRNVVLDERAGLDGNIMLKE